MWCGMMIIHMPLVHIHVWLCRVYIYEWSCWTPHFVYVYLLQILSNSFPKLAVKRKALTELECSSCSTRTLLANTWCCPFQFYLQSICHGILLWFSFAFSWLVMRVNTVSHIFGLRDVFFCEVTVQVSCQYFIEYFWLFFPCWFWSPLL